MPSLKSNDDFGKPSPTNSIISSDDELSDNDLQEDSNDIQESSVRESDDHLDTEENDEVQDDYEESTIRENDDQYNCNRENDDQGIQGRENDDQSNPGIENDDQCQIEEQVNWVGAIKSSNTRQCLRSSQTLSTENDDLCQKEEKIDNNPKLEVGRNVGNALAVVNDESKLLDDPKQAIAEISSSKETPASKLRHQKDLNIKFTSEMEVEHNLHEIFEISTDDVEQEGTDNESAATNAVAEFKNIKLTLSGESGIPRGDLICFDVQEIRGEDQVEVAMYNNDDTKRR